VVPSLLQVDDMEINDGKLARARDMRPRGAMDTATGTEIVCPDGIVRNFPYRNHGDAECDARVIERRGCNPEPVPGPDGRIPPPCPGGRHMVRPTVFREPVLPERGLA